jgi:multidrug resistance protein, MATE family
LANWGPMIRLALPSLCMIEAEYLAFEVLTLAASYISTKHLAAQTILQTLGGILWQLPFPMSIVATTRIAQLIGAAKVEEAKLCARTAMVASCAVGAFNAIVLSSPLVRWYVPEMFIDDNEVVQLVVKVLPLVAAMQFFDAIVANTNGILRGIGRQRVGSLVGLTCFYGIALPFSFWTTFWLGWDLMGLWSGVTIGLCMIFIFNGQYLIRTDWEACRKDAEKRNRMSVATPGDEIMA